jgi:hypothetical protein
VLVILVTLGFYFRIPAARQQPPSLFFFSMGAGFMLLETQVISRLALYFGTTWQVNGVVISIPADCTAGCEQGGRVLSEIFVEGRDRRAVARGTARGLACRLAECRVSLHSWGRWLQSFLRCRWYSPDYCFLWNSGKNLLPARR